MRRSCFALFAVLLLVAGCGSSAATQTNAGPQGTQTPAGATPTVSKPTKTPTPTTDQGSGTGSVTVTIGGANYTVGGGSCGPGFGGDFSYAQFGDWLNGNDPESTTDYVSIDIYPDGHADLGGGRVNGTKFYLNDSDQTGTIDLNTGGTFSGTDDYGAGTVSGTFTCK
jgi:hypothetical protein